MNINNKLISLLNSFKMGSSSASSHSEVFFNIFKPLCWNKCNHDNKYKITNRIYLKRVPFISDAAYKSVTLGRIFGGILSLGLSETSYGIYKLATNAGDGPNHYFLEMNFECSICHESRYYTIDFTNDNEINFRCGYFQFRTEDRDKKSGCWGYNGIRRIIDDTPMKKFDPFKWNSQHFARNLFYNRLK